MTHYKNYLRTCQYRGETPTIDETDYYNVTMFNKGYYRADCLIKVDGDTGGDIVAHYYAGNSDWKMPILKCVYWKDEIELDVGEHLFGAIMKQLDEAHLAHLEELNERDDSKAGQRHESELEFSRHNAYLAEIGEK